MEELKLISHPIDPPHVKVENPPWKRIYKFALGAWIFAMLSLALAAAGFLSGCGGGGSSSNGSSDVVNSLSGYVLPGELSAVPASKEENLQSTSVTSAKTIMVSKLGNSVFSNLAKAFNGADTNYTKTRAHKFVEEPALEQFSVLEDVLTALDQTKYYNELGQPAYKAMVTMVGEGDEGKEQKSLQPWVVEADIVDADGNVVEPDRAVSGGNYDVRVRAWIEEGDRLIKGQFLITDPPTQIDDGSYADYGTWTLNVSFDDTGKEFFAASCSVDDERRSIIKLHETMGPEGPGSGESMNLLTEVKAIMNRSETEGYGKVSFPDWDALYGPGADPNPTSIPTISAKYAYNEDYVGLKEEGDSPVYKDRTNVVEMTHNYGVFRYDNGDNIMRHKTFGFPFYYFDETAGYNRYGYYGAWQGRHQIWMDMGGQDGQVDLAALKGLEVTKDNHGPDAVKKTYTIGKTFNGTLVKRDYVNASLNDIKNIPVEIWVNKDYQLLYMTGDQGLAWYVCKDIDWSNYPTLDCSSTPIHFESEIGYESLVVGANDNRKNVNINGWDESAQQPKDFVYLMADTINGNQAGFYEAQRNSEGRLVAKIPLAAINTSNITQLWVWIGGSLWVEYNGSSWVEKEVVSFDENTWMPEFGDTDRPYTLPSNNELYINMQGASYVVKNDGTNVTVQLELQTTLNPKNAATLLPSGTILRDPWDMDKVNSTYKFVIEPKNTNYLMLVYASIGQNDKDMEGEPLHTIDEVVETGMWGLETTDGKAFNWEYSGDGGWGSITYLKDGDKYLLLDDPVRFKSLDITHNDETKTLGLQFDGWMMGLPDLYWELERNNWEMTDDIKDKIINLPAGTVLTSVDDVEYVLKPLEISQFLMPVSGVDSSSLPDLTQADSVDLETVPDFEDHNMGAMPSGTQVLYSEGIPTED